jgi:uncharacterized membrane protein YraQ (UPF0718 family)
VNLLPSALPWTGAAAFPGLLVLVAVLLFSTATLAFYIKQRVSLGRLGTAFAGYPGLSGNAAGALLGAATPFCTCTALPLFVGMLEVEVPLGPAVSFLLASPSINLGAIVVLVVVFGPGRALFYGVACLTAAVAVGWAVGRMPRERAVRDVLWIEDDTPESGAGALGRAAGLGGRLTRRLLPWLALATAAGILLDALIPTSTVTHLGTWGVLAIPAAAVLGAVVYADILLLIPMGYALVQHGAPAPLVLTFMLAASGLSLPELVVLGRVLHPRLALAFAGLTVLMYTLLGYGFSLM